MRSIDRLINDAERDAQRATHIVDTQAVAHPEKVLMLADVVEELADTTRDLAVLVKNLLSATRDNTYRIRDIEP